MGAGLFGLGMDLASSAISVAQSLGGSSTKPTAVQADATTTSTASSASSSGDISSNDFLTLLVTEMKNQDPTQPTDPNAYIQQLTEVNSLQQLIAINQDLTPTVSSGGSGGTAPVGSVSGT